MQESDRLFSKSKTFCIYPFTHLNIKANGQLTVCNRCAPIAEINTASNFKDFWQSEQVEEIRRKVLNNERPVECVACWKLEDSGATSYRQESLSPDSLHYQWLLRNKEDFHKGIYSIKELELRFGNLCNLQCKMCSPKFSSKWERELHKNEKFREWIAQDTENGDIYDLERMVSDDKLEVANKLILEALPSLAPSLEYVMYSGGEPLLQRDHYRSLECLLPNASNIVLEYTSNLNYLNFEQHDVLEYWKQFKKVIIKVSMDGDPLIYPYVRAGGDVANVELNIERVKSTLGDRVMLIGTCTTSIYNVCRLPEIMDYFNRIGILAHTSQVEYPTFLSPQVLPTDLKKPLADKLDHYLERIQAELNQCSENEADKKRRLLRIIKWTKNSRNFCLGSDESYLWGHFLKFNSFWDPDNKKLLSFYPEWSGFV